MRAILHNDGDVTFGDKRVVGYWRHICENYSASCTTGEGLPDLTGHSKNDLRQQIEKYWRHLV